MTFTKYRCILNNPKHQDQSWVGPDEMWYKVFANVLIWESPVYKGLKSHHTCLIKEKRELGQPQKRTFPISVSYQKQYWLEILRKQLTCRGACTVAQWLECWTWDQGVAGLRLTRSAALCPWVRHFILGLVLVQPRKTRPCLTERLLMWRNE